MGEDRERQSQFEHSSSHDREENENLDEDEPFEQPSCPRCGWHNTRLSHTSNVLDMMAGLLGMRAYRCRSCGKRFRARRRTA
jgi:DNA-directed RNA polymerase subunit RPC12/RpoP